MCSSVSWLMPTGFGVAPMNAYVTRVSSALASCVFTAGMAIAIVRIIATIFAIVFAFKLFSPFNNNILITIAY